MSTNYSVSSKSPAIIDEFIDESPSVIVYHNLHEPFIIHCDSS